MRNPILSAVSALVAMILCGFLFGLLRKFVLSDLVDVLVIIPNLFFYSGLYAKVLNFGIFTAVSFFIPFICLKRSFAYWKPTNYRMTVSLVFAALGLYLFWPSSFETAYHHLDPVASTIEILFRVMTPFAFVAGCLMPLRKSKL